MKKIDEFRLKGSGKICIKASAYSEPPQRQEMETRMEKRNCAPKGERVVFDKKE